MMKCYALCRANQLKGNSWFWCFVTEPKLLYFLLQGCRSQVFFIFNPACVIAQGTDQASWNSGNATSKACKWADRRHQSHSWKRLGWGGICPTHKATNQPPSGGEVQQMKRGEERRRPRGDTEKDGQRKKVADFDVIRRWRAAKRPRVFRMSPRWVF